MPSRIQRQRTKGYRLPEGAVYAGCLCDWPCPDTGAITTALLGEEASDAV